MKILYDHQAFAASRFGGVARYFYNLMTALQQKGIDVRLSIRYTNNHYLLQSNQFNVQPFRYFLGYMKTSILISQINRTWSCLQVVRRNYDLFHPTFFHPYFLWFIGDKPYVVTYHDVIKEKFGDRFGHVDNEPKRKKQKILDRAAHIIAVSENTKKDLIDIFQLDPARITVIHHATNFQELSLPDTFQIQTPDTYLLYVGDRSSYKNFNPFLGAIASVLKKYKHIQLVCAGGGSFDTKEVQLIDDLGLTGRVTHYSANDFTLYRLYQHALAFVYPSLYEGFGMPILEAFAAGCPVVLSNTSCFPEVAQDAALYFNPESETSIREQIETIIQDEQLRQSLRRKGHERQLAFSSEKMVNQTLQVYQRAIAQAS